MGFLMVGRQVNSLAEWAKAIATLRRKLQMTQTELANKLGVTAMTVSRWERGLVEPTASGYIGLGNLAGVEKAWYFWKRAGLDEAQVRHTFAPSKPRAKAKGLGL